MSSTARGGKRSPADFYSTPTFPVKRFLERVKLPGGLWCEPAAGEGSIIKTVNSVRDDVRWFGYELREKCFPILKPLLSNHGFKMFNKGHLIGSFLDREPVPCDVSITNPPFHLAMEFILHSLRFAQWSVHLLRLNFLGTEGRNEFFKHTMPDVYVVPDRISFAQSVTCTRNKKSCGFTKMLPVTARAPRECPKCGAATRVSSTDSIEYCWMVWGPERKRDRGVIEVLDHTPLEQRR